ncbi:lipoprotein [Oleidesulfovibrio alaskensis]|uniref:LptM family lipoprotein n=1 Tax=Oleidesulfovibrio alaskensis TaxID=58180 RepID=UPI001A366A01|nr:hypothetical protein [Oleidesulfovibrio alaskensis]MBL3582654.1 hypothetical protein [Oleidesulfovibrio alaskensis]
MNAERRTTHARTVCRRLICLCALLTLAFSATGCGKKGPPLPMDKPGTFTWVTAQAVPAGDGCIGFSGSLQGDMLQLDSVVIELEAVAEDANCPSCPFKPTMRRTYSAGMLGLQGESTEFMQTICVDDDAASYRWRFVARSTHRNAPYGLSTIKMMTLR